MASASSHRAAAIVRDSARAHRARRRAVKAVTSGPASAFAHLTAMGIDTDTAHRYAATLTKRAKALGETPVTGLTVKKRPGKKGITRTRSADLGRKKRHRITPVALWTRAQITAALHGYQPRDTAARERFARLALTA
ncbi:hypothetical protein [Streptomyces boncukensis]|uniref:Uncharacterized protein n=1 Tax=Streptomyces boncukensis TaxID=2711219 RepID=A0A6G4WR22_9ACTN|nr:hypothetical protein [Streptomyces boncukensis]NGO67004.1 hypothetical protein [Streptomyces boncukensis]